MRLTEIPTVTPLVEVCVVGALDLGAVARVRTEFDHAAASGPAQVVVDLAACDFVDAAGVGLLVDMHQQVRSVGGRLTLRGGSSRLRRAMEVATVHWQLQHASTSSTRSSKMQTW